MLLHAVRAVADAHAHLEDGANRLGVPRLRLWRRRLQWSAQGGGCNGPRQAVAAAAMVGGRRRRQTGHHFPEVGVVLSLGADAGLSAATER
jgi:hypothetical protein